MSDTHKKLVLILAAALVTVGLLEGLSYLVLRVGAAQMSAEGSETHLFDAHRDHRLNPDFAFASDPKAHLHSADGFRSATPVALQKSPNTIRIIALGTSALYGLGAAPPYPVHRPLYNDETITAAIQARLNQRLQEAGLAARVEVINAGVSAYKTFHHVVHMLSRLVHYQPDIVINVDGHNDFYFDHPTDGWNSYPYSTSVLVDEMNGRTLFLPVFTLVRALAPHSHFFALAEKLAKRYWQNTKVHDTTLANTPRIDLPAPADQEAGIHEYARQSYLRDLTVIRDLGKSEGYEHLVFAQPEVLLEDEALLTEADRKIKAITLQASSPDQAALMAKVAAMLPKLFAARGLTFHDLTRISVRNPTGQPLYVDYCHLSPNGAKVLGEAIADILAPGILARARKPARQGS